MIDRADLDLYTEYRIATYMHAVYERVGRDRGWLEKAAEDCAGWYDVSLQTVVDVWRRAHVQDLIEIENAEREDGECQR